MKMIEVTDPFGFRMHINASMVVSVADVTKSYSASFPEGTPRITEIKLNTASNFSHTFVTDSVEEVIKAIQ